MTENTLLVDNTIDHEVIHGSSTVDQKYYIKEGGTEVSLEAKIGYSLVETGVKRSSDGSLRLPGTEPEGLQNEPVENIETLYKVQEDKKRQEAHAEDVENAKRTKVNQSDQLSSLYNTFMSEEDIQQARETGEEADLLRKLTPSAEVLKQLEELENKIRRHMDIHFNTMDLTQKKEIAQQIRNLRTQRQGVVQKEIQRLQTGEIDRHTLAPLAMKVNTRFVDANFKFKPGVTLNVKKLRMKHRINTIVSSLNEINQLNKGNIQKMSEEGLHRVMSYRKNHDRWIGSAALTGASYIKNRIMRSVGLDWSDAVITEKFNKKKALIAEALAENGLVKSSPLHAKIMSRVEAYRQLYLKSRVQKIKKLA